MSVFAILSIIHLIQVILPSNEKLTGLILLGFISLIIAVIGIFGVALFDYKIQAAIHTMGAVIFFVGGVLTIFFFTIIFFFIDVSKIYSIIGIAMTIICFIFLFSFVPFITQGADLLNIITSPFMRLDFQKFMEWTFVFTIFSWFLKVGIFALK